MLERREVYYRGTVQGVGFRYTAVRIAQRYPVRGYVRNLSDGRVELVAEGTADDLGGFLAELQDAFGSMIEGVDSRRLPAENSWKGFTIRY